jgi:molecular chaperone DnaK
VGYGLGIDLGTTWTAACVWRNGRAEPCTLGTTSAVVPSVVCLRADGEVLVGEAAARRALTEPARTAREFKRRLGDPTPLLLGGTPFGAEALLARLLEWVLVQVTEREGAPPERVVLTHPAAYGDYKKALVVEAAHLAGLAPDRVALLTEPQAAALAYAREERVEPGSVIAVYDLGGGTFDAAAVRKTPWGFELAGAPDGIERFGGIDIDQAVLAHVDEVLGGALRALDPMHPERGAADAATIARLRDEARAAKEALSADTDTVRPRR